MKLKEIMSSNPIVFCPDIAIREAVHVFAENDIDGAAVVDEGEKIIGLFTKTHVYRAIEQGLDMNTPIEILMKRDVLIGHPDDKVEEILYKELGRLPVVDNDNKITGMITRTDLASVFFDSYHQIYNELQTIIDSTHNMILSVDEKGRIKVFNKSAEKMFGFKAEEVKGKDIMKVIPSSRLMEVIETGRGAPLQRIRIKDSDYISNRSPIKKDGKIIGAVAVLQNITEMEKLSEELSHIKELNEELDAVFESSYDGLYITDGNGKTLRLNKAFEMIMGVNSREFLGKNVSQIEEEGIVSKSVSLEVLKRKELVTIIQQTKAGKTTLATGNPVFDEKGNIVRVVSNVRDITELNMLKQKLEQFQGLRQHYENQLRTLRLQYTGSQTLVVKSAQMRDLLDIVMRLAKFDSTILISGESGTGKELIAETIHNNSKRNKGPFIRVNCGAIPETLLESELFGYESGAFTGAKKEGRAGYFEMAADGTLFLDEIGDLPFNLQVKLLRFLQNKEITRVGGGKSIKVDARILTATNRNLIEMVKKKEFREDLYYRLNVIPVYIPPLRERKEDIPSLVVHFLQLFNRKYRINKRISPDVVELFIRHEWPGNVRELENLIERLVVITTKELINVKDLPSYLGEGAEPSVSHVMVSSIIPLQEAVESVEKQLLERVYAKYSTTRQMARELKVNASTVVRKAAKYGISKK